MERVGDEYGEKSKLLGRDRSGEMRDLTEDALGELQLFNRLSPLVDGPEEDDWDIRGRRRLRSERVLGT